MHSIIYNNYCFSSYVVDGGWTEWDEWSECSVTCDNGTQTRHRSCTNPLPQYGGKDCEGERTEVRQCFLRHCPVDCVWLEWSDWGNCSHECGGGIQFRSRDQLPEQYGGEPCEGLSTEMQNCNEQHCPGKALYNTLCFHYCTHRHT